MALAFNAAGSIGDRPLCLAHCPARRPARATPQQQPHHPSGSITMQAQASKIARFEGMKSVAARPSGRVCAAAPRASRRAAVKVEAQ